MKTAPHLLPVVSVLTAFSALCQGAGQLPDVSPVTSLKPLYPRTVLVQEGRAVSAVVVPREAGLQALAGELVRAIDTCTGAELRVHHDVDLVDESWGLDLEPVTGLNLIALGNVNTNRLLAVLYGERYVVADSIYPGAGGYVVRTVHDPFVTGTNILVLAGSGISGVKKAVAVFTSEYLQASTPTLLLPQPLVDVVFEQKAYPFFPDSTHSLSSKRQPQYTGLSWFCEQWQGAGFMNAAGNVIAHQNAKLPSPAVTGLLARAGQTYFRTGNPELLPLMQELVEKNAVLLSNLDTVEGMGGRSADHVHEWDLLEELPIWSDAARLAVTNALLADAALGHERRAFHQQVADGAVQALDENHGTCSALRSFTAWHYFHKYYPSDASAYWMRCADAVFDAQASTFQILEDASGYLCYCPIHSMQYALRRRNLRYLGRGIARHHARYVALASVNNLGLDTGFGDSSSLVQPAVFELLAPAAWYYRDPKLSWVVRCHLPQACGLRIFQHSMAFDLGVEPTEPTDWTGLIHIPLYDAPLAKGDATAEPAYADKTVVDPALFNKLVFKENWTRDGQYLLLDGAGVWAGPPGPHGHKQNDINTIINLTAHGRMWLVDHSYQVRDFQDHSGVYVLRDGKGGYRKRTLARILDLMQNERFAFSRTQFMDWQRAIFWRKGVYFLVLDRVEATAAGDTFARCSFRALGTEKLRGKDLYLSQAERFCKIVSDGGANVDVETFRFTNSHWASFYGHTEPVARVFQQDKKRQLAKGDAMGFANLIVPYSSPGEERHVTMQPVSEFSVLVDEGGERTLLGMGELPGGYGQAGVFAVSSDAMVFAGVDVMPGGDIRGDGQCNLSLALATGRLTVEAKERRMLALSGELRDVRAQGQPLAVSRTSGAAQIAVPPGRHELQLVDWSSLGACRTLAAAVLSASRLAASQRTDALSRRQHSVQAASGLGVSVVKLNEPLRVLVPMDVDGDGTTEWLVGGDRGVSVYEPGGAQRWHYGTEAAVRAVDAGDVDGDGTVEVAFGCDDEHVVLLDHAGRMRWSFRCQASKGSTDAPPAVDFVRIADLEHDGPVEVVAGANWVHVLRADGTVRWERYMDLRRGLICGDFICGAVDDVDADGKMDVVALFATSYPLLQVLDCDGRLMLPEVVQKQRGLNIGVPVAVEAVRLVSGLASKQIACATRSAIRIFWHDHDPGKDPGMKTGGPTVVMDIFQPEGAGAPVAVWGSPMCGVWAAELSADPTTRRIVATSLWHVSLDEKVTALLVARLRPDGPALAFVGTKQGNVHVLDLAAGTDVGRAAAPGAPVRCLVERQEGGVLAAKADGTVLVLSELDQAE